MAARNYLNNVYNTRQRHSKVNVYPPTWANTQFASEGFFADYLVENSIFLVVSSKSYDFENREKSIP